jgi:hypothetical protein
MSIRKFKFVSPGVFTREIDQSQLPAADSTPGPVIIGRLPQGPAMEPVAVRSYDEFVQVFGNPIPGRANGDVWRDGNYQGPTYAAYAAQAYLRNSTDGVTIIRLAGLEAQDSNNGDAGWETVDTSPAYASNGGAFGLYVCANGGNNDAPGTQQGYLGAVFYVASGGAVILTGSLARTAPTAITGGIDGLFGTSSNDTSAQGPTYRAAILDAAGTVVHKTEFNFDPSSRSFIRKVFNTNPQTVNTAVVPSASVAQGGQYYWLGETYESWIQQQLNANTLDSGSYGLLMAFDKADKADYNTDFKSAESGWFFSQDLSTNNAEYYADDMQKLFKVHALEPGKWVQDNIKISIQDLSYSRSTSGKNNYATFTLVLRRADDSDKNQQVVERYSNLSLNPMADNYISKKIGDKYVVWDQNTKVLREYGDYNNVSKYIRIQVNDAVQAGTLDPNMLPFGVEGPTKFRNVLIGPTVADPIESEVAPLSMRSAALGAMKFAYGDVVTDYTASLNFPEMSLRLSSSAGDPFNQTNSYFGAQADAFLENGTGAYNSRQFSPDWSDMVNRLAGAVSTTITEPQWRFSLDEVVQDTGKSAAYYLSGSRVGGSALSVAGSKGWRTVVDNEWTRFTAPLFGGFDGLDITELEPFRNTGMAAGATRQTNYALNTLRTAIELINDPEVVEMNVATIPGVTNENVTRVLVETCEERGDALAIIDLPDVYLPYTEGTAYATTAARGTVSSTITNLEDRQLDSSYGCTYYPWVQIQDTSTSNNRLWVPPSVAALGTFASSEAATEVWFAPAGFNRGGLSTGAAGLPVLNVSQKLTSRDRDNLYDANINPIASFPSEGIVIFGQKTLQITPSALDRINVRRMMIFVKKQVSIFANQILFDQNVRSTWNRFIGLVDPFLASVKSRLGISEYKLILDETTTTPDLVDQNIVYAKIFIKPAKAIEYIALDFFITNQGASFED